MKKTYALSTGVVLVNWKTMHSKMALTFSANIAKISRKVITNATNGKLLWHSRSRCLLSALISSSRVSQLLEPYDHVDLHIQRIPGGIVEDYVGRELELMHGDLHLDSSLADKPPLSRLGRALIASRNETPTTTADELRHKIIKDADSSIALLRLRLEACQDVYGIDDALRYRDRFPESIVAMYDEEIARILAKPERTRDLGLKAILAATTSQERYFSSLKSWLQLQESYEDNPEEPSGEHELTLVQVLSAAGGLVVSDNTEYPALGPCSRTFFHYVEQCYNEPLFRFSANLIHESALLERTVSPQWSTGSMLTDRIANSNKFIE